ncbi:hypothetical protein VPH35_094250 [Triticum aestivum]
MGLSKISGVRFEKKQSFESMCTPQCGLPICPYPYLSTGLHSPHCPPPHSLSNAAAHGALRLRLLLRRGLRPAPRPPLRQPRAQPPPTRRPRVLDGVRRELLRGRGVRDPHPRPRRRGGRGRGRVVLRFRRDVGLGGGDGAGGARDAALPSGPPPVRDHGRAPPRHVRGGAPRPHPALRGAARGRGRHVRGGVQQRGHPAGLQHQEEEQQDRAALHLLRRHLPPLDLLHQARVGGRAADEVQRRRRRHPLDQLQSSQEESLLEGPGV